MNFQGAPYPIVPNPRGFLYSQGGVNQIKSDLLVLLLTNPGERTMLPLFGTPLKTLFFDPNDPQLVTKATSMISTAISTWEPRITVSNIQVYIPTVEGDFGQDKQNLAGGHILGVKIEFYDPNNIQDVQALTLEIPLAGS